MAKQKVKQGIHLYNGKGGWYWNLISRNGRTLARSSETYTTKQAAEKSITSVAKFFDTHSTYYDHTQKELAIVAF